MDAQQNNAKALRSGAVMWGCPTFATDDPAHGAVLGASAPRGHVMWILAALIAATVALVRRFTRDKWRVAFRAYCPGRSTEQRRGRLGRTRVELTSLGGHHALQPAFPQVSALSSGREGPPPIGNGGGCVTRRAPAPWTANVHRNGRNKGRRADEVRAP